MGGRVPWQTRGEWLGGEAAFRPHPWFVWLQRRGCPAAPKDGVRVARRGESALRATCAPLAEQGVRCIWATWNSDRYRQSNLCDDIVPHHREEREKYCRHGQHLQPEGCLEGFQWAVDSHTLRHGRRERRLPVLAAPGVHPQNP